MKPPAPPSVTIENGFWSDRLTVNRDRAIHYQWERYEQCGTVDNFRIAAGLLDGPRKGFFYTDSDLHKWADAASRILLRSPEPRLRELLDRYVELMVRCQEPDGYLFTYNQIHFPGVRWKNLQIEHELYCIGHFIEAGIAHHAATGGTMLLECARKSADLVVREFLRATASRTSGHQEIEIALLRLYRLTGGADYLATARALLERRGRTRLFALHFVAQVLSQVARSRAVNRQNHERSRSNALRQERREQIRQERGVGFELGENLTKEEPRFIMLRSLGAFLSGSYQQQHAPLRRQVVPRGHAVRWSYIMTAAAMLQRETGDESLARLLGGAWERLVEEKMYVTGGIGSLPIIEGFGRAFELDNRYSYSETCAAIGSVLWNREMSLATGEPRYADMIEWQLYNAVSVGLSLTGDSYFYRNPLASDGTLQRKAWYATACCPSNISRLLADLDTLLYTIAEKEIRIEQYVSSMATLGNGIDIRVASGLPWEGSAHITVRSPAATSLRLRIPGWAEQGVVRMNGTVAFSFVPVAEPRFGVARFQRAGYLTLAVPSGETTIDLDFPLAITLCTAHPKIRADRGRAAVTRGPLVYCAESVDNPGVDPSVLVLDPESLAFEPVNPRFPEMPGMIEGSTIDGAPVRLIPYSAWGNRGPSAMAVWLRVP